MHKLVDVKGELNKLFRDLGPLIAEANNLVSMGHSLDLSESEKNELRSTKNEIEEWQKKLNKINSELNELSKHPDSKKRIECYLDNYYSESNRSESEGDTSSVEPVDDTEFLDLKEQIDTDYALRIEQFEKERRQFMMESMLQKMKHDMAMNAIRNIHPEYGTGRNPAGVQS